MTGQKTPKVLHLVSMYRTALGKSAVHSTEAEDLAEDYDIETSHYGIQYKLGRNTKIGVAIHDQENSSYAGVKGS